MLKIVATITNYGAASNCGGDISRKSAVIDIPTSAIPSLLKDHLAAKPEVKKWETASLSFLVEET